MSTPVEKLFDAVEMKPTGLSQGDDGKLVAVMTGELTIAGLALKCAVLSDGSRVFYGDDIESFMNEARELAKAGKVG